MNKFSGFALMSSLRALPWVVGACVATSALVAAPQAMAAGMTDDAALVAAVHDALAHDASLYGQDAQDVVVTVQEGHAHLTGWVTHPAEVAQALHDAMQVNGIKSVDANLRTWASS